MSGQYQMQSVMPITPMVKKLIIINVAIWLVGILILENMILGTSFLTEYFGMTPGRVVYDFWIWQPFTYSFLHSEGVFHVLFNMLLLWMFGSELERRWGSRFFLIYYMVTAVGAGFFYTFIVTLFSLIAGDQIQMSIPVIGASGAGYGIILAYGILFSERVIYFMMLFPMKAKWFAAILAFVSLISAISSAGSSGTKVAHLAHLGGIVVGWLFLVGFTRLKQRGVRKKTSRRGRKLKLVVDNERDFGKNDGGPKYWN